MSKTKKSFLSQFIYVLKPCYKELFLTFLCIFLGSLIRLQYPLIIKIIVDDVLINKNYQMLSTMLIIYILLFVLGFTFTFLTSFINSLNTQYIAFTLRKKLFQHLQKTPISYLNKEGNMGEITSTFNTDIDTIGTFLSNDFLNTITNSLSLLIIIVIMFLLNWSLSMFVFLVLPFFCLSIIFSRSTVMKLTEKRRDLISNVNKLLQDVFVNIKLVKLFIANRFFLKKFLKVQDNVIKNEVNTGIITSFLAQLSQLIFLTANIIIIWYGANLVFKNVLTIGGLMAFYTYVPLIFMPINVLVQSFIRVNVFKVSLNKIFNHLDIETEVEVKSKHAITEGNVEFKNVFFTYNNKENMTLKDINLKVSAGEKVALIGKNGSGKTTLVNLLLKLYPINNGNVFIDGMDINKYNYNYLRKHIGIVTQEVNFFNLSIMENLKIASMNSTYEEVVNACKFSGAYDFINCFPEGFDTIIGQRGYNLSGGQLQKLSISRLILKEPKIIIFDEATSSLDPLSTETFYNLFKTVFNKITILFIVHDLERVKYADRIVLMRSGEIEKIVNQEDFIKSQEILSILNNKNAN